MPNQQTNKRTADVIRGATLGVALAVRNRLMADRRNRQERLLDEALQETFPASDPISVMQIT